MMRTAGFTDGLLGKSAFMEQLRHTLRKAAPNEAPALIRGEPGAGKKTVARILLQQSPRAGAPCVHFDCAALADDFIEDVADLTGGTLLLEEVGALSITAQERLLSLRQSPIGSSARIIATSSRDLEAMAQANTFREDLLLALNIVPIFVPPLRERAEDIPLLAEHFRSSFARKHGVEALAISPVCLNALKNYSWPGNVRELRDAVERAVIRCQNGVLGAEHFSLQIEAPDATPKQCEEIELLEEIEKEHIFVILERCRGNRTHAAKRLGISLRTLRNKLREYRLAAEAEGSGEKVLVQDP